MNIDQLKEEVIAYSKTIGIDKIGFTTADPFTELKNRLFRQQEFGFQSGFEEPDIEKRVTPALLLPEPRSIISIALAYPSKMKVRVEGKRGERRGFFSRASWGLDYHHILRDRLKKLEIFILAKVPDARLKSMVDTGELSDRAVAVRAGIGWSGKNCAVMTPEFGSYVYLGEMITSIPFVSDTPMEDQCGSCTACIEACPTGALVQGGQINAQRCIAFLTQTKAVIPEEFRDKIGNRVYGCDSCQTSCPVNKGKDFHFHEEMEADPELAKPLLRPLLKMSNREFKNKFGPVAGSWRGKKPIQRNAIIALAHFKDETAIPDLQSVLENETSTVLKETAAWALGKIGSPEAVKALEKVVIKEDDLKVKSEIEKSLLKLKN
ncbi:epoxyqueuosine reductase [Neobacillus niacini]|uniref:tRNA epoxyqueuosine(34) reductase QueG n=1 Tax=Neobacillus niacini TaxID=86668 RepID=UPI002863A734|nr:tRNA epoxyqueuosine(34) reductase QueG [Neobacillus niacini]MDR7076788.1 epoxyqueuosine reductase [Neobacillus niacini]